MPNYFPEGEDEGVYHTADASLWFFHALQRYLGAHRRRGPPPRALARAGRHRPAPPRGHAASTSTSIRPTACSRQGAEGFQLTWMDAKVDGWVVTPRRGKAVEINALWFNAVCAAWRTGRASSARMPRLTSPPPSGPGTRSTAASGTRRPGACSTWWMAPRATTRRSARTRSSRISLAHPVLRPQPLGARAASGAGAALRPVGLRTLSPRDPDSSATYDGDLRARDAAYHQGTVWPWLLGHYVDAWLKVHPDRVLARDMLRGLEASLRDSLPRADRRDLRRHPALPAPGLLRAGLERGRGAADLARDALNERAQPTAIRTHGRSVGSHASRRVPFRATPPRSGFRAGTLVSTLRTFNSLKEE